MLTSTDDVKAHRQQQQETSSSLSVAAAANQEVTFFSSAAKSRQSHHLLLQQNRFEDTTDIANSLSIAERKQSMVEGAPDVGILSKDFLKNKGQEEQSAEKQYAIHRKKQAVADVDVGILSNGRRQQQKPIDTNLHAMNEVVGRSLQNYGEVPYLCPDKNSFGGSFYFDRLFDKTDGYFPKCSCPNPTTCGPDLCECLELDADGDILQCMDPFNQLCEGTKYISGIPGPWSFEECIGSKSRAIEYCSWLPCYVDGGSWWECKCSWYDKRCTEYKKSWECATSKCCQAQTDDEGREACIRGGLHGNYYDQVTSFWMSPQEMISRFNECSFNSGNDKSIVQCYCESFSYKRCVNNGVKYPDYCEAMNCCFGETEDDARLDCFSRFRHGDGDTTGEDFYYRRDEIQESCVASGKSSDRCKCDIQGLSRCVRGIWNGTQREPRCDLFQCCQSQTGDNDDGRKDCLVQDEARLVEDEAQRRYEICVNDGNTTESSCYCDKSNSLCSSGHSNDRHCELSSCCQEQANDTGRKECIGNFTSSQPSSAPSESLNKDSIDEAQVEASTTSAPPSTSGVSISTHFGAKPLTKTTPKMLAAVTVIGWLIFT